VISHPCYSTSDVWQLCETELHLDVLPQSESVFALGNGHVGWRGNLDEGEPHGLPGSYLNGVYEVRPLPYAEAGYGYPESGQSVIDVTNGKVLRLLVDDEPFDLRYGRVDSHERVLDFRTGLLTRTVDWTSPAGARVVVRSTRLVSLTQRAIAAVEYQVEPVGAEARIVVQSELVANEQLPSAGNDPRVAAALESPLVPEEHHGHDSHLRLVHRTRRSGLRVATAAAHVVQGPRRTRTDVEAGPDLARFTVVSRLRPGERLRLEKTVAYGWSSARSLPALRDQVDAALAAASSTGWAGLAAEQREYLADFWERADVEVEGDPEIQQAVRFALFHVLQAGARAEERPIAAKGLTGSGYDGHCFWDTETYVLPVLTYTCPPAAAQALRWRYTTIPAAGARARQLGLRGAAFPWRTITGEECSGYWPAGTAAFHVNAAVAEAAVRQASVTGDEVFERETALPLLVATARLWMSLGHTGPDDLFHIDGVTGPDEYSAVADDNAYTNLMAQSNLRAAADAVKRHPDDAQELEVTGDEAADWLAAADAMAVPYNASLGVHEQSEGFTSHAVWDFDSTEPEQYPLMLHFPYFDLYRKQVVKQADLVLAMFLRSDAFTPDEKARNFAYYEPLTVRDSSLSACCQAVMAAETGHLRLAYDYLEETALMDLYDLENNTRNGLHIASLAGSWTALVAGFGGLRRSGTCPWFAPRLPEPLTRLAFRLVILGRRLRVEITDDTAVYSLAEGDDPLRITHYLETVTVSSGSPVSLPVPPTPPHPDVKQPPGRAPVRRRSVSSPSPREGG
jgi:alpha,alpha-trehalose phosphorylase